MKEKDFGLGLRWGFHRGGGGGENKRSWKHPLRLQTSLWIVAGSRATARSQESIMTALLTSLYSTLSGLQGKRCAVRPQQVIDLRGQHTHTHTQTEI
jgi:hypothetical protein